MTYNLRNRTVRESLKKWGMPEGRQVANCDLWAEFVNSRGEPTKVGSGWKGLHVQGCGESTRWTLWRIKPTFDGGWVEEMGCDSRGRISSMSDIERLVFKEGFTGWFSTHQ